MRNEQKKYNAELKRAVEMKFIQDRGNGTFVFSNWTGPNFSARLTMMAIEARDNGIVPVTIDDVEGVVTFVKAGK